jgi:hypothetical protein
MFAVREYIEHNSAQKQTRANGELEVSRQHFEQALRMLNDQNGK